MIDRTERLRAALTGFGIRPDWREAIIGLSSLPPGRVLRSGPLFFLLMFVATVLVCTSMFWMASNSSRVGPLLTTLAVVFTCGGLTPEIITISDPEFRRAAAAGRLAKPSFFLRPFLPAIIRGDRGASKTPEDFLLNLENRILLYRVAVGGIAAAAGLVVVFAEGGF